jgi:hypothetical protein
MPPDEFEAAGSESSLHSSGALPSAAGPKLRWFFTGALALAVAFAGVAVIRHVTRSTTAPPAIVASEVVPFGQVFLLSTLNPTNPKEAKGVASNDPTGTCSIIWQLPSNDSLVHLVVVQPLAIRGSSPVTILRLSLPMGPGPSAIGPSVGGAFTFPVRWHQRQHFRAEAGAVFVTYTRFDIRGNEWTPGTFDVDTSLDVTYSQSGFVHSTAIPLDHPACLDKPNASSSSL